MLLNRIFIRDLALALVLCAIGGAVIIDTVKLPPGMLDSLGPAAVPKGISLIIIGLAVLMLVMRLVTPAPENAVELVEPPRAARARRPWAAVVLMLITAAYTEVLQLRLTSFAVATVVFLVAAGLVTMRASIRSIIILLLLGIVMGFGGQYIFTQFFYVDLP